jgi:hypothetical protein
MKNLHNFNYMYKIKFNLFFFESNVLLIFDFLTFKTSLKGSFLNFKMQLNYSFLSLIINFKINKLRNEIQILNLKLYFIFYLG